MVQAPLDAPTVRGGSTLLDLEGRRRVEVNRTVGRTHDPHEGSSVREVIPHPMQVRCGPVVSSGGRIRHVPARSGWGIVHLGL